MLQIIKKNLFTNSIYMHIHVYYAIKRSDSAPLAVQLKARFVKFMSKALEHDNPVVKYIAKVSCLNPMSVSGRNWRECNNSE